MYDNNGGPIREWDTLVAHAESDGASVWVSGNTIHYSYSNGSTHSGTPQNCYIPYSPWVPYPHVAPQPYVVPMTVYYPAQLSDSDIDRIADAVAKKLKRSRKP